MMCDNAFSENSILTRKIDMRSGHEVRIRYRSFLELKLSELRESSLNRSGRICRLCVITRFRKNSLLHKKSIIVVYCETDCYR